MNTTYNAVYTDMYFKRYMKNIISKNTDVNKYYKAYILKKNMVSFNYREHQMFYSEKYNSDGIINDINNIQNLEKKEEFIKPQLINMSTNDFDYDIDKMYEDLDAINFRRSGNSIKYFHHMGCDIKLMMCSLIRGGEYNFEKVPKISYESKIVSVIKNKDNKCFLYCYIRKFHNKPKKHGGRISLIDKEIVKKIEDETNYNFDNVEIKQLSKIEDLVEINIYVYGFYLAHLLLHQGRSWLIALATYGFIYLFFE